MRGRRRRSILVLAGVAAYLVLAPVWLAWAGDGSSLGLRDYAGYAAVACISGAFALFPHPAARLVVWLGSLYAAWVGRWLLGPVMLAQLLFLAATFIRDEADRDAPAADVPHSAT